MLLGEETTHHSFKAELMSSGLDVGCADCAPVEHFLDLTAETSRQTGAHAGQEATAKSKDGNQ